MQYTLDLSFADAKAARAWLDTPVPLEAIPEKAFAKGYDAASTWNEILRVFENDAGGLDTRTSREILSAGDTTWTLKGGRIQARLDDVYGDLDADRWATFQLVAAFARAAKTATNGELFLFCYTINYDNDLFNSVLTLKKSASR